MVVTSFQPGLIWPYIKEVFPLVERSLERIRRRAERIPQPFLREQALASIKSKKFHCQGGAVFALYTPEKSELLVDFIVAFQTISDYLDNLCDRHANPGERAMEKLHEALLAAAQPEREMSDWYGCYPCGNDGGYLDQLVETCRGVLGRFPGYPDVREEIVRLTSLYSELQVFKHLVPGEREERLLRWWRRSGNLAPEVSWWEFAAACGSTLGIFLLAARSAAGLVPEEETEKLLGAYFPWVCGLHILLDYFIDLDEDKEHGDLNFVSFYPDEQAMEAGMSRMLQKSLLKCGLLPYPVFHKTVVKGMLAMYLSDPKAGKPARKKTARRLLVQGGNEALLMQKICHLLRLKNIL